MREREREREDDEEIRENRWTKKSPAGKENYSIIKFK